MIMARKIYFKGHNHVKPETVNFNYIKIYLLTNNNNKVNKQTNKQTNKTFERSTLSQCGLNRATHNITCRGSLFMRVTFSVSFYGKTKL